MGSQLMYYHEEIKQIAMSINLKTSFCVITLQKPLMKNFNYLNPIILIEINALPEN